MKSFASLFMSLVLTAAMLTGCGCTNRNMDTATATTLLPTNETTVTPSTQPTQMTTVPTTGGTQGADETINHGNGPLVEDGAATTEGTTEDTAQGRAGQNTPIR